MRSTNPAHQARSLFLISNNTYEIWYLSQVLKELIVYELNDRSSIPVTDFSFRHTAVSKNV